jgi:hypothetical protein
MHAVEIADRDDRLARLRRNLLEVTKQPHLLI